MGKHILTYKCSYIFMCLLLVVKRQDWALFPSSVASLLLQAHIKQF